jgi:hypothetical protein
MQLQLHGPMPAAGKISLRATLATTDCRGKCNHSFWVPSKRTMDQKTRSTQTPNQKTPMQQQHIQRLGAAQGAVIQATCLDK